MKIIISSLMSLLFSVSVMAGDAQAGKAKSVTCTACHGANGIGTSSIYPNIAGQKKEYLVAQLKDFRSGKRVNPNMSPMAKPLTDADIENLAEYYSGISCNCSVGGGDAGGGAVKKKKN